MFWKFKYISHYLQILVIFTNMTDKPKAAGSIWNVNSWHWEMKNYTDLTKKILEERFLALVFEASNGIKITHTKVKFTKGEAQVNIRKGKQILIYDFQLDFDVLAESDAQESKGTYKVRQILSDDLNDLVVQEVKANQKNKCGDEIKKWIKKNAKERVIAVFKQMQQQLVRRESDPEKLEEDKRKREEAQKATQKAKQEKGEEKQRLLEQQKQKERRLKEEAYKKHFQNNK